MGHMDRPPVVIDIGAVVNIASELLAVGDELTRHARPLRLPIMNPASDPFTVRICARINHTRASLGAIGTDAGEELTRMAEFLLASAFNLHHIANWTNLVIRGANAAPLAPSDLRITPRPCRADPAQHEVVPYWSISTDCEARACAELLCAGDQEIDDLYFPDPRILRALGQRLRACSARMRVAWATAEPAATKYAEFAQWISGSFSAACEHSAQIAESWKTLYAGVRAALQAHDALSASAPTASPGPSPLNETLELSAQVTDAVVSQAVRDRLDIYAAFDPAIELCTDYPQLKV